MADRRMFSKQIIDSDAFIDLPVGAKLLYYDLGMRADDDGFVNSPRKIMRISGASQEDFDSLVEKKFILEFESGVIAIKHWYIHNNIRKDRYHETNYKEEKAQLSFDENNAYTRKAQPKTEKNKNSATKNQDLDNQKTEKIENVTTKNALEPTEVRLGKDSIGEDNIVTTSPAAHKKVKLEDKLKELVEATQYGPELKTALKEWIDYHVEIKKPYKGERSFSALLKQVDNKLAGHTEHEMAEVINLSMAQTYTGILFKALEEGASNVQNDRGRTRADKKDQGAVEDKSELYGTYEWYEKRGLVPAKDEGSSGDSQYPFRV